MNQQQRAGGDNSSGGRDEAVVLRAASSPPDVTPREVPTRPRHQEIGHHDIMLEGSSVKIKKGACENYRDLTGRK
ncbi:MAG: hypothetical protein JET69_04020 [Methanomassiliicoccales archaeon]|nr:hypothetical protein [Methanomassiliicoccales archaeon]